MTAAAPGGGKHLRQQDSTLAVHADADVVDQVLTPVQRRPEGHVLARVAPQATGGVPAAVLQRCGQQVIGGQIRKFS